MFRSCFRMLAVSLVSDFCKFIIFYHIPKDSIPSCLCHWHNSVHNNSAHGNKWIDLSMSVSVWANKNLPGFQLWCPAFFSHRSLSIIGKSCHMYYYCHDKRFVTINTCFLWQPCVCHDKACPLLWQKYTCLLRQNFCLDKHTFVMPKDVFCHNKHVFVMTEVCL